MTSTRPGTSSSACTLQPMHVIRTSPGHKGQLSHAQGAVHHVLCPNTASSRRTVGVADRSKTQERERGANILQHNYGEDRETRRATIAEDCNFQTRAIEAHQEIHQARETTGSPDEPQEGQVG